MATVLVKAQAFAGGIHFMPSAFSDDHTQAN